ncbi:MAG: hypothetical protein ACOC0U_07515 [Desulfovibrionales bacterium]
MNFEEKNGILSKRFWDMSEEEVDQAVDSLGIEGWRKKVREDTRNAQDELALGPNPWAWDSWSENHPEPGSRTC